jgi:hypothetical protein
LSSEGVLSFCFSVVDSLLVVGCLSEVLISSRYSDWVCEG